MKAPVLPFVRLLALAGLGLHLVELIANIAQTWDTFNPSYWSHYLQQQLARPLAGLLVSAALLLAARPVARWISRGSHE